MHLTTAEEMALGGSERARLYKSNDFPVVLDYDHTGPGRQDILGDLIPIAFIIPQKKRGI